MHWLPVGFLSDIPQRGARCIRTPRGRIAIFRTADDQVFALEDRCPHRDGPLSQGIVHGHAVTCPLHNWVIGLESGEALGADEGQVQRFPVRVEDGALLVGFAAANSDASQNSCAA